jgi:uroporphyrinogen III methyltransferase/synthase
VAVTSARAQASGLAGRLAALGASVIEAPTIRTRTLDGPLLDPTPYDLICLTSANGVERLFERLAAGGRDARSLAHVHVAAIGGGTARALAEHGIAADVVPERFVAESLVEALGDLEVKHALLATASGAREVLPEALRARGAQVDVLALYETVAEPLSERALRQAQTADYITFTSSSSVRYFLDAPRARGGHRPFSDTHSQPHNGESATEHAHLSPTTRIVSIGPVTSATLRERGLEPHVEAERHDIDGLVDALLADALLAGALPADTV